MLAVVGLVVALLGAPAADTAPGDLADLGVSKVDDPDPVLVGSTLTYTVKVTNQGPQGATGIVIVDRLPRQVDFVSASASGGSCEQSGRRVTCQLGSLAADPSKSLTATIQVRPRKAGTFDNTVSVDSLENDPISLNNTAEASTTVQAPPLVSSCRGVTATITGTRRADILVGTEGPDVIAGLEGDDVVFGLAGRDLICSGGGRDSVGAGTAADRVFGGVGADLLRGRRGPDLLAGNPGADFLAGNHGSDRLRGGQGLDRCRGGAGFDRERGCER